MTNVQELSDGRRGNQALGIHVSERLVKPGGQRLLPAREEIEVVERDKEPRLWRQWVDFEARVGFLDFRSELLKLAKPSLQHPLLTAVFDYELIPNVRALRGQKGAAIIGRRLSECEATDFHCEWPY